MRTLVLILLFVNLTSCVTPMKIIPGAEVSRDRSFRSLNTYQIHVEMQGGMFVTEARYSPSSSLNRLDQAFKDAERYELMPSVITAKVKPVSNYYKTVLIKK